MTKIRIVREDKGGVVEEWDVSDNPLPESPIVATYLTDMARTNPATAEHQAARGHLDAYLALIALQTADKNAKTINKATWALVWLSVVLALATIGQIVATVLGD